MAAIGCVCPPKADGTPRHANGDTVTLKAKLSFREALAARNTVILIKQEDEEASPADILAALTEVYLLTGVESWTLKDAQGRPVPVNRNRIRAFMADHPDEAMTVGDEADGLFMEAVITPLVVRASSSLPPTPINGSMSATSGSVPVPRKRSKPSSITTSQTGGTERMSASPDGDYNS